MHATLDTPTDTELLREYRGGSQQALAELVRRHVDWVYSAARRQVRGDAHLAEDVTQAVFIVLAERGKTLGDGVSLGPWLFGVTRFAAANARRAEERRRTHETKAASMKTSQVTDASNEWSDIEPELDEMVANLRPKDRQAVVLRFYQQKSHAEIGTALGCSADAARKRIEMAVGRLRDRFAARGVTSASIAALMLTHVSQSAPPALGQAIAEATLAGAASSIAKGTSLMMTAMKVKVAVLAAVGTTVVAVGGGLAIHAATAPAKPSAATTTRAATPTTTGVLTLGNQGRVTVVIPSTQARSAITPGQILGRIWVMRMAIKETGLPPRMRDDVLELTAQIHASIVAMLKEPRTSGDEGLRSQLFEQLNATLTSATNAMVGDRKLLSALADTTAMLQFELDLVAQEKTLPLMITRLDLDQRQKTAGERAVTQTATALRKAKDGEEPAEARSLALLTGRQQFNALLTPAQLRTWQQVVREEKDKVPPAGVILHFALPAGATTRP